MTCFRVQFLMTSGFKALSEVHGGLLRLWYKVNRLHRG